MIALAIIWLTAVVLVWLFLRGATRKQAPRAVRKTTLRELVAKQKSRGRLSRREVKRRIAARERGGL